MMTKTPNGLQLHDPTYLYKCGYIINDLDIAKERIRDALNVDREYNLLTEDEKKYLLQMEALLNLIREKTGENLSPAGIIDA